MEKIVEILFSGLSTGAIYALIALGFVLIFKSTGVLNFAQGELAMVGAFVCYSFAQVVGIPYFLALALTIILACILGILIDFLFFRRMVGEPVFSTIMVTVGLGGILTSLAGIVWGPDIRAVTSPFTDQVMKLGGLVFSQSGIYTIVLSVVLFALFGIFFNRSLIGTAMKGTAEDSDTASLMGINITKINMIAWAMGTVIAAVAGVVLAEQSLVHISMSHTGIKAMSAAILGGMESLPGAIVGGLIVGVIEAFAATYLSGLTIGGFHFGDVKDVAAFAIMIVVLMIRPRGIFGKEEVERV